MNNIINKCLKSYLCGKKYLDIDKNKSNIYFNQCIKLIDGINNNNIIISDNYKKIINDIEIECYKYIDINLFNIIEKGYINILNNLNNINFKVYNENGLTPLHYAIDYGDISFLKYALKNGCCIDETTLTGYTLLEYACLKKDPNIIYFLTENGACMKKHIEFRKDNKYINNGNNIDIILLYKLILDNNNNYTNNNLLEWIFNYIDPSLILEIKYNNNNNITFKDFILHLNNLLNSFNQDITNTYNDILKEELDFDLLDNNICPNNKIEIILYNLLPFINYNFNLNLKWLNNYYKN